MPAPAILRRRKAALLLASGEAKSRGEAMILAGYPASSAHTPGRLGLTAKSIAKLAREGVRDSGSSIESLRDIAMVRMREILKNGDIGEPATVAAVVSMMRLARELGAKPIDDDFADRAAYHLRMLAAIRLGRIIGRRNALGMKPANPWQRVVIEQDR